MTVGVVSEGSTLVCETPMRICQGDSLSGSSPLQRSVQVRQSVVVVICLHIITNHLYENKCTIPCTVLLVPKKGGLVNFKNGIKAEIVVPDFYSLDQLLDAANQLEKLEKEISAFKSFVTQELGIHYRKIGEFLKPPAL